MTNENLYAWVCSADNSVVAYTKTATPVAGDGLYIANGETFGENYNVMINGMALYSASITSVSGNTLTVSAKGDPA